LKNCPGEVSCTAQQAGLMTRLREATETGELRGDADLNAVANALIGTLLLQVLTGTVSGDAPEKQFDGLLSALLSGLVQGERD
jgi:hypothetical protein